jgi:DNA-binding XRE family transcriptional regulator
MVKKKPVKRITKIAVDSSQTISQLGIQIPKIDYKVIADVTMQTAFNGMITPIPTVLIHHLKPIEFLLVAVIIEETVEKGECALSQIELADRMGVACQTAITAKSELIKQGLINYEKKRNHPSLFTINWDAVNSLDELMKDEPRAIMARVRKVTRKTKIKNLDKSDVQAAYTERILPLDHDPREEETYD